MTHNGGIGGVSSSAVPTVATVTMEPAQQLADAQQLAADKLQPSRKVTAMPLSLLVFLAILASLSGAWRGLTFPVRGRSHPY
jgi:hypothetical protein